MEIRIAFASDDKFAQHMGVAMVSILYNSLESSRLKFYIIDGGISEDNKQKLKALTKIKDFCLSFLQVDETQIKEFPASPHNSVAPYYRIKLPSLLKNVPKVLYLDCDVIVTCDLTGLWNIDISKYALGAVENINIKADKLRNLNIPEDRPYFNSGVLLMNLERMRVEGVENKVLTYLAHNHQKLRYVDQDALNAVLYDDWLGLDPKWNQQYGMYIFDYGDVAYSKEIYDKALRDPAIIHYTTPSKPWHYLNTHKLKHEYWKYLQMTPWRDYKAQDYNLGNFLRKNLPPTIKRIAQRFFCVR